MSMDTKRLRDIYPSNYKQSLSQFNLYSQKDQLSKSWIRKLRYWTTPENTYATQLFQEWSIHGVALAIQPNRNKIERLFWLCTLLCSTSAAIYLSCNVMMNYYRNPMIVSFQPATISTSNVPFPAITVCNVNKLKKSEVAKILKKFNSTTTAEAQQHFHRLLQSFYSICTMGNRHAENTGSELTYDDVMLDLEMHGSFEVDVDKNKKEVNSKKSKKPGKKFINNAMFNPEIKNAFHQCDELIKICYWEGHSVDCQSLFYEILIDFGFCCVFNMMPRRILRAMEDDSPLMDEKERALSPKELEEWKNFNLDKHIITSDGSTPISNIQQKESSSRPRHQLRPGQTSGLTLLLHPDINESLCTNHEGLGYKILPHSPIEYPHVEAFGLAVGVNREVFINLKAEVTTAEEDIRSLPLEKRQCYFQDENPLKHYGFYSDTNCLDECVETEIITECGCILYDMYELKTTDIPFCTVDDLECVGWLTYKVDRVGLRNFCKIIGKPCYRECNGIAYKSQSSYLPMDDDFVSQIVSNPSVRNSRNVTLVHIYYGSQTVLSRVRKRLFTSNELFANVGGILGLFLGFSVISVMELAYFIFRMAAHYRRSRKLE